MSLAGLQLGVRFGAAGAARASLSDEARDHAEEASKAKVPVSLATVYNTLNQLTDAGLLRQVSVDGTKTYLDTNVSAHHHFYLEHNHELVDIPDPHLVLQKMPDVPEGYEISRVDMVVRLRKKS